MSEWDGIVYIGSKFLVLRKAVNNKMSGIDGFYRQTMHSYFLGTMWCFVRIRFLELELSEL